MLPDLTLDLPLYILVAAIAGMMVGFSKTAIPGLGIIVVPLLTLLFASKESTAVMVVMLIVGDLFAVQYYHRHADWKLLLRLIPFVFVGIVIGYWIYQHMDNRAHMIALGALVLALTVMEATRQLKGWNDIPNTIWLTAATGILAGIATTIGNAAGPIMGVFLLSQGLKKDAFMGTGAWYYLILNCTKVPFYLAAGTMTAQTLTFDLMVAPAIVIGALLGAWALPKIPQKVFTQSVLVLGGIGGAYLLIRGLTSGA